MGVEVEEWRVGVWVSDAQAFLERERIGGKRGYGIGVYGGVWFRRESGHGKAEEGMGDRL